VLTKHFVSFRVIYLTKKLFQKLRQMVKNNKVMMIVMREYYP